MSSRRVESFLLRVVIQDDEVPGIDAWRGRIQHVTTGDEQLFFQFQDVMAFISAHIGQIIIEPVEPPVAEVR